MIALRLPLLFLTAVVLACAASGCATIQPCALNDSPSTDPAVSAADHQETVLENLRRTREELDTARAHEKELTEALNKERAEREDLAQKLASAQRRCDALQRAHQQSVDLSAKLETVQSELIRQQEECRKLREELLDANIANTRLKQTVVKFKIEQAREQQLLLKKRAAEPPGL